MKDDPIVVAPEHYRVVFENSRVRVLRFHADPGAGWRLHSHPDMVVVSTTDYTVRNLVPGSTATVRNAKRNDAVWVPERSHTGENAGSTAMDCVLVELKEAK